MTKEHNMDRRQPNVWKFISVIGIPVTAILTWVFVAGGIVQDVKNQGEEIKNLKQNYTILDNRVRSVELGIVKIETQYKTISETLVEIKNELKDRNNNIPK
jgi:hypothetical protein